MDLSDVELKGLLNKDNTNYSVKAVITAIHIALKSNGAGALVLVCVKCCLYSGADPDDISNILLKYI